MIYITLTDSAGGVVHLNIEAIGYFSPYRAPEAGEIQTEIYVTGGAGGTLLVREPVGTITKRLTEAGCEFI